MNRKTPAILVAIVAVPLLLGAAVGQSVVGGAYKMVGDYETFNNIPGSDWNTAIAESPTIRLDGSAGTILLGPGDTTDPGLVLQYTSAGTVLGRDTINTQIEGGILLGAVSAFTSTDATPDVSGNSYWNTASNTYTLTDFDGSGIADGQIIWIVSTGATTYDMTSSGLKGGSADIVTADGDVVMFLYDGTDWILVSVMLVANDYS